MQTERRNQIGISVILFFKHIKLAILYFYIEKEKNIQKVCGVVP